MGAAGELGGRDVSVCLMGLQEEEPWWKHGPHPTTATLEKLAGDYGLGAAELHR